MFFNFSFWRYVTKSSKLAIDLENSSMRGFGIRVVLLILSGIVVYALRDIWGMTTTSLSPVLATATIDTYIIARLISVIGSMIWAILYIAFHLFFISYVLHVITSIPWRRIIPLQFLVTGVLLIEKMLVFFVFAFKGQATAVSFFSFGPLAATFSNWWFLIMFLNQLTIFSALIVNLQYNFLRTLTGPVRLKRLLAMLIGLQILLALLTTAIGYIPFERLFNYVLQGGMN